MGITQNTSWFNMFIIERNWNGTKTHTWPHSGSVWVINVPVHSFCSSILLPLDPRLFVRDSPFLLSHFFSMLKWDVWSVIIMFVYVWSRWGHSVMGGRWAWAVSAVSVKARWPLKWQPPRSNTTVHNDCHLSSCHHRDMVTFARVTRRGRSGLCSQAVALR